MNQEICELEVKEFFSHYGRNKFRTSVRILKPSSLPLAVNDNLIGFGSNNLSFGVDNVSPTMVVSVVVGMNISLDQMPFSAFVHIVCHSLNNQSPMHYMALEMTS